MDLAAFISPLQLPPLQRLICGYIGRGLVKHLNPEYYMYIHSDDPGNGISASQLMGEDGDTMSLCIVYDDIDIPGVAYGAALKNRELIINHIKNVADVGIGFSYYNNRCVISELARGYVDRHKRGTPTYEEPNYLSGIWNRFLSKAMIWSLLDIESDNGAMLNHFYKLHLPIQHEFVRGALHIFRQNMKKCSSVAIKWLRGTAYDDVHSIYECQDEISDLKSSGSERPQCSLFMST